MAYFHRPCTTAHLPRERHSSRVADEQPQGLLPATHFLTSTVFELQRAHAVARLGVLSEARLIAGDSERQYVSTPNGFNGTDQHTPREVHDSHIRIDAKRQALDALDNARRSADKNGDDDGNEKDDANGDGPTTPDNGQEIPLLLALEGLTSQSRHSLPLSGSQPSAKLLIPLERRDVRVVEGARLESKSGKPHRVIPRYLISQSIQELPKTACSSV